MINDASISGIIKSWQKANHDKLKNDHDQMKARIHTQMLKISKEELINQAILEVYSVMIFDQKKGGPSSVTSFPDFEDTLKARLSLLMDEFYTEAEAIGEDGFNLMTYLEYVLNEHNSGFIFWCSYPQISYDIMEQADTYHFTLIQFDAKLYRHNLYFNKALHPLIKSLYYNWISQHNESSYDNTFRKAAANMNDLLHSTWDHINILSTLKYEGSENHGSILFIDDNSSHLLLSLETPVPLSEYRQIRKLLQMSRPGHYLIVNKQYMAVGFGYVDSDDSFYRIDFLDHLNWKIYLGDLEFLSCSNLLPLLPSIGSDIIKLKQQLARTFTNRPYNEQVLMTIIKEAKFQRKGTMIVITEKAKEEANRLHTSSMKVAPIQLTINQIKLVSGIDGALIIDTQGYCHAIGSILDGFATEMGDSSRGARYNSALRYLSAQIKSGTPCLIAVISEDRYVDILSTT